MENMTPTPTPPAQQEEPAKRPPFKAYLKTKDLWATIGILIGGSLLLGIIFFYLLLPIITQHNDSVTVPMVRSEVNAKKHILLDEAIDLLEEADLQHEIIDSSLYMPEYPPLAVVGQDPEPGSSVKPGRRVYLKVNRRSAPQIPFPNIIDISFNQARYTLENWKLQVGSTRTQPGLGDNLVMRAYYRGKQLNPGDKVPERASIDLVLSQSMERKKVRLPNVVGKQMDEAFAILQAQGFMPRPKPVSGGGAQGTVLKQIPTPKDSVVTGSVVVLEVVK